MDPAARRARAGGFQAPGQAVRRVRRAVRCRAGRHAGGFVDLPHGAAPGDRGLRRGAPPAGVLGRRARVPPGRQRGHRAGHRRERPRQRGRGGREGPVRDRLQDRRDSAVLALRQGRVPRRPRGRGRGEGAAQGVLRVLAARVHHGAHAEPVRVDRRRRAVAVLLYPALPADVQGRRGLREGVRGGRGQGGGGGRVVGRRPRLGRETRAAEGSCGETGAGERGEAIEGREAGGGGRPGQGGQTAGGRRARSGAKGRYGRRRTKGHPGIGNPLASCCHHTSRRRRTPCRPRLGHRLGPSPLPDHQEGPPPSETPQAQEPRSQLARLSPCIAK